MALNILRRTTMTFLLVVSCAMLSAGTATLQRTPPDAGSRPESNAEKTDSGVMSLPSQGNTQNMLESTYSEGVYQPAPLQDFGDAQRNRRQLQVAQGNFMRYNMTFSLDLAGINIGALPAGSPGLGPAVASLLSDVASAINSGITALVSSLDTALRGPTLQPISTSVVSLNGMQKVTAPASSVSRIAGSLSSFGFPNTPLNGNVLATNALMAHPHRVLVDPVDNSVYFSDSTGDAVHLILPSGVQWTIVRVDTSGITGFDAPGGMFLRRDASTNTRDLFVATGGDNVIYRVNLSNLNSITATRVAGVVTSSPVSCADETLATECQIESPWAILLDAAGGIFYSERNGNRVRYINATTGRVRTVMGSATGFVGAGSVPLNMQLSEPADLMWDPDGSGALLVSERSSHRVRRVRWTSSDYSSGVVTVFAGTGVLAHSGDGGQASSAAVREPFQLASDRYGSVYVLSGMYQGATVRRISSSGIIQTVAGMPDSTACGSFGSAPLSTSFKGQGVTVMHETDGSVSVILADTDCHVLRKVSNVSVPPPLTLSILTSSSTTRPDPSTLDGLAVDVLIESVHPADIMLLGSRLDPLDGRNVRGVFLSAFRSALSALSSAVFPVGSSWLTYVRGRPVYPDLASILPTFVLPSYTASPSATASGTATVSRSASASSSGSGTASSLATPTSIRVGSDQATASASATSSTSRSATASASGAASGSASRSATASASGAASGSASRSATASASGAASGSASGSSTASASGAASGSASASGSATGSATPSLSPSALEILDLPPPSVRSVISSLDLATVVTVATRSGVGIDGAEAITGMGAFPLTLPSDPVEAAHWLDYFEAAAESGADANTSSVLGAPYRGLGGRRWSDLSLAFAMGDWLGVPDAPGGMKLAPSAGLPLLNLASRWSTSSANASLAAAARTSLASMYGSPGSWPPSLVYNASLQAETYTDMVNSTLGLNRYTGGLLVSTAQIQESLALMADVWALPRSWTLYSPVSFSGSTAALPQPVRLAYPGHARNTTGSPSLDGPRAAQKAILSSPGALLFPDGFGDTRLSSRSTSSTGLSVGNRSCDPLTLANPYASLLSTPGVILSDIRVTWTLSGVPSPALLASLGTAARSTAPAHGMPITPTGASTGRLPHQLTLKSEGLSVLVPPRSLLPGYVYSAAASVDASASLLLSSPVGTWCGTTATPITFAPGSNTTAIWRDPASNRRYRLAYPLTRDATTAALLLQGTGHGVGGQSYSVVEDSVPITALPVRAANVYLHRPPQKASSESDSLSGMPLQRRYNASRAGMAQQSALDRSPVPVPFQAAVASHMLQAPLPATWLQGWMSAASTVGALRAGVRDLLALTADASVVDICTASGSEGLLPDWMARQALLAKALGQSTETLCTSISVSTRAALARLASSYALNATEAERVLPLNWRGVLSSSSPFSSPQASLAGKGEQTVSFV